MYVYVLVVVVIRERTNEQSYLFSVFFYAGEDGMVKKERQQQSLVLCNCTKLHKTLKLQKLPKTWEEE